jgi:hypothetical protein
MDWIEKVTRQIATVAGVEPERLLLDDTEKETLLDLAGVAAHTSGDRTNAPLLCHVIGRAMARGASLEDCERAVRAFADEA